LISFRPCRLKAELQTLFLKSRSCRSSDALKE
jgi:hypothetical protein